MDLDLYRNTVADLTAVFLRAVLDGDAASVQILEKGQEMPVEVKTRHNYHGNTLRAGCTHP